MRLYVLRHAKSDWEVGDGDDRRRPLAKRGRRAAKLIGRWLTGIGEVPDLVLTSAALRARETVEIAAEEGGWGAQVEYRKDLYGASVGDVLAAIRARGAKSERLLVAGHEPTSSALVSELIGKAQVRFPTAALACLELEGGGGWRTIKRGNCRLLWMVLPRTLAAFEDSL